MLNLFKKATNPDVQPSLTPLNQPQVFEVGKEVQSRDPKTGEFIYQRAITPEHRQEVMIAMTKNAQAAQKMIQLSRNKIAIDEQFYAIEKEIRDTEKNINDIVNKIRDDYKLDKRWGLNPQLGVLERRDSPSG